MKFGSFVLCLFPLFFFSCDTKTKTVDPCGDGFVDPGEECDSTVGEFTCGSLGHYNLTGTLTCAANCTFDRTDCGGRCGDNSVDASDGEDCDGGNLNSNSCANLGFGGGTLACDGECHYDTTGCSSSCGNDYREQGEACDDGNTEDNDGCSSACTLESGWECNEATPNGCSTICGDGLVVGAEPCDGTAFAGDASCVSLDYYGGTLACTETCALDLTPCEAAGSCGDGVIQASAGEVCEVGLLDGMTCEGLGYYGGDLSCSQGCMSFKIDSCESIGRCGDGIVQGPFGEDCDGIELDGRNCETQGYHPGILACNPDCTYNFDTCGGFCGDGTVQGAYEACDGDDLDGKDCSMFSFYGGTLACDNACTFVTTNCVGSCGDN
ncbi:DUF4215 domain-containing protein, partial [Myxococcota bacterium]|nr:DUF4215 domain-containing protein [Myxococcota bacterium]